MCLYILSISKPWTNTRSTHVRFLRPPYLQRRSLEATRHPATTRRFRAEVFETLRVWMLCLQAMDNVRVAASYVHGGKKPLGFAQFFKLWKWCLWCVVWCDARNGTFALGLLYSCNKNTTMKAQNRRSWWERHGCWIVDRWSWRRTCQWAAPCHGVA